MTSSLSFLGIPLRLTPQNYVWCVGMTTEKMIHRWNVTRSASTSLLNDRLAGSLVRKCDHPYHLGCLNPPLQTIPEGEWFCPKCTDEVDSLAASDSKPTANATGDEPKTGGKRKASGIKEHGESTAHIRQRKQF